MISITKSLALVAAASVLALSACTTEPANTKATGVQGNKPVALQADYQKTAPAKADAKQAKARKHHRMAQRGGEEFDPSMPPPEADAPWVKRKIFPRRNMAANGPFQEDDTNYIPYILIALLGVIVAVFYIRKSK